MLGQFTVIPHGLFPGRLAVIFWLDEVLELGDTGIINMHKLGRVPWCEGHFPAKLN